ncbi:hypothetical protein CHS0354_033491 [Potamilus streckersoni]|uniref:Uncharacterized protein n=1 Tax=Potamilus streckersoni TaxID=2493646 RepID=A0AAE0SB61_9BIVA|nr:hypothetical protein CHS0354_033491 [Potamilus streckersoni]
MPWLYLAAESVAVRYQDVFQDDPVGANDATVELRYFLRQQHLNGALKLTYIERNVTKIFPEATRTRLQLSILCQARHRR